MSARWLVLVVFSALALNGCEKWMHNMYDQSKYETFETSRLWQDGSSARNMPAGTIAQEDVDPPQRMPELTQAFMEHGRNRFNIYCAPCHSIAGDGEGMVPSRGFPNPPSFHSERLRAMPDQHFYDVITNGYGVMYSYAARVPPMDRWAIIAYIRALQLSRHASLDDVPLAQRQPLEQQR